MKNYSYDVFISHAVEDKAEVANELYRRLKEAGVNVWYSGEHLEVGGDLYEMIKDGLNKSRNGILILSPNFFEGEWPLREFHVLWAKKNARILPVWHNITKEEIAKHDSELAECWAVKTESGMDHVVQSLVSTLHKFKRKRRRAIATTLFIFLLLASFGSWQFFTGDAPPEYIIQTAIEQRISTFQEQVFKAHNKALKAGATPVSVTHIKNLHDQYEGIESYYRNWYSLTTGYTEINFKKNVEPALRLDFDSFSPENKYTFKLPNTFKIDNTAGNELDVQYIFLNTQSVGYELSEPYESMEDSYEVSVSYENYIRYLTVSLQYTKKTRWMKHRSFEFMALLPNEIYRFEKEGEEWVFIGVE